MGWMVVSLLKTGSGEEELDWRRKMMIVLEAKGSRCLVGLFPLILLLLGTVCIQ